jgi:hypothetical protein
MSLLQIAEVKTNEPSGKRVETDMVFTEFMVSAASPGLLPGVISHLLHRYWTNDHQQL